jgi:perosamine synthetase
MGIETRTFFIPLHNQPFLGKKYRASKERFPVAEDIARRGLYLPSGSGLKKEEIAYVCDCIKKIKDAA